MSRMPRCDRACLAGVLLTFGSTAAALDVKPGLWEITTEGAPAQRVCYTAEVLESDLSSMQMPPGVECRNDIRESSGTRVVTHSVCTGTVNMEGDTVLEVQSPESMTMASTSVMTFGGQRQTIEASASYRFVAADCGDVRPFDPNTRFE